MINVQQSGTYDCGRACLYMLCRHFDVPYDNITVPRGGMNLLAISQELEKKGLMTLGVKAKFGNIKEDFPFPFLALIGVGDTAHYIVVWDITKSDRLLISDPNRKEAHYISRKTFEKAFYRHGLIDGSYYSFEGVALLIEKIKNHGKSKN